ncbi:IucA/IucC family protein [Paenibacillus cisolokensis]|uniref:IucA/IucC family protein n=1 Tax=Paenibacillus cisolokensis TaxID=1658519 RepID=UPI003D2BCF2F
MPDKRYEEEAERRVMEDLLNALLAEELLVGLQVLTPQEARAIGEADPAFAAAWKLLEGASATACGDEHGLARPEAGQGAISAPGELIGLWRPHGEAAVVFGLRSSPWQRLRCMPAARVAAGRADGAAELLAPAAWMRLVAEHRTEASGTRPADAADVAAATGMARAAGMAGAAGAAAPAGTVAPAGTAGAAEAGAEAFIDMLRQTAEQIAWSLERRVPVKGLLALPQDRSLLALERCAALRDRPFHPVAKVKLGWGRAECGLYTAEAGQPIRLRWMAVRRDRLLSGGAGWTARTSRCRCTRGSWSRSCRSGCSRSWPAASACRSIRRPAPSTRLRPCARS